MANPTKVILQAVAEVQGAIRRIAELRQEVVSLGAAVDKNVAKKFDFETDAALKDLAVLEKQLNDVVALSQKAKIISVKADVSKATSDVQKLVQTVEGDFKQIETISKSNPFKSLSDGVAKEAQELSKEFDKIERNFRRAVEKLEAESRRANFDPLGKSALRLAENVRFAAEKVVQFADRIPPALQKDGAAFQNLSSQVNAANAAIIRSTGAQADFVVNASKREQRAADDSAAAIKRKQDAAAQLSQANAGMIQSVLSAGNAMRAFFASIIVSKLKDLIVEVVETGAAFEGYTNTLAAAVGGTTAAAEEMDRLRGVAKEFGINFEVLAQRFPRFATAAASTKLELGELRNVFDGFVIASRAVGNSTQQTERILYALEQIMSKGVVQAEELKQQLGDSLPTAYASLAKAIGVTTAELATMLKENKVLAEEALPALAAELLKTLGPAVVANATSVRAEIERLKNAVFDAKVEIAEGARPELIELLRVLGLVGDEGALSFKNLGDAMGLILDKTKDTVTALNNLLSLDFKGFIQGVVSSMLEGLTASLEVVIKIAETIASAIPGASENAKESFRILREGALADLKLISEGLEDMSEAGANSASAIAEANAVSGRKVVAEYQRVLAENQAAYDKFKKLQEGGDAAVTDFLMQELAERQTAYAEYAARVSATEGEISQAALNELSKRQAAVEETTKKIEEQEKASTEKLSKEFEKRTKAFQKEAEAQRKAHQDLVASLKGDTDALAESTNKLLDAISAVERSGSVNQEVAGKVQDSIQKQIDSYAEFGIAVPEQLQKVADKWGVISTAQEKAMEEQKKRVDELKKEIQSLDDELTALEAKLAGSQKDIFGNLIGSGGEIQKLRDEIRKIETQPGWISVEDIQRAEQLREKIREIERARTSAPSGNDPQTLADLDKLAELQGKRNDLENELIGTEGDLIRQQESLARSTDNLSDSAAGAGDSFAGASGGIEDWLDQIGDAADQMGDARTRADRLAREVEDSGEAAGEAAEGFDDAGESVRDFGGAADEATESLKDAADAAGAVGDEAEKASDKAEEAFSGLGSGANELNEVLPITYGWLVKIAAKAREIAAIEL